MLTYVPLNINHVLVLKIMENRTGKIENLAGENKIKLSPGGLMMLFTGNFNILK